MEYIVCRTSLWLEDKKPCDEAYMTTKPSYQTRTCSEEEYNRRYAKQEGGKWRERGSEHSVTENGYIRRRIGDEHAWCVKIDTLDELNSFAEKYGDLVLTVHYFTGLPMIEIYDDYRE